MNLHDVLNRMATDAEFAQVVQANPAVLVSRYGLTEVEAELVSGARIMTSAARPRALEERLSRSGILPGLEAMVADPSLDVGADTFLDPSHTDQSHQPSVETVSGQEWVQGTGHDVDEGLGPVKWEPHRTLEYTQPADDRQDPTVDAPAPEVDDPTTDAGIDVLSAGLPDDVLAALEGVADATAGAAGASGFFGGVVDSMDSYAGRIGDIATSLGALSGLPDHSAAWIDRIAASLQETVIEVSDAMLGLAPFADAVHLALGTVPSPAEAIAGTPVADLPQLSTGLSEAAVELVGQTSGAADQVGDQLVQGADTHATRLEELGNQLTGSAQDEVRQHAADLADLAEQALAWTGQLPEQVAALLAQLGAGDPTAPVDDQVWVQLQDLADTHAPEAVALADHYAGQVPAVLEEVQG